MKITHVDSAIVDAELAYDVSTSGWIQQYTSGDTPIKWRI